LHGIAETFSDVATVDDVGMTNVMRGPDGLSGCIVVALPVDRTRQHVQTYQADRQEWTQIDPGLYIGVDQQLRPHPFDLARSKALKGYPVTLADGHSYVVPVVRRPDWLVERLRVQPSELPSSVKMGAHGSWTPKVKSQHAGLFERMQGVAELFFEDDGSLKQIPTSVSMDWGVNLALEILGLNYRIGANEQTILDLLDNENWGTVLAFAIDAPLATEYKSRQQLETANA
jgi:hypothetical protein